MQKTKGVVDTLEMNDIKTKIKCLNAVIKRIKFEQDRKVQVSKKNNEYSFSKPSKNGFISDKTFSFLSKILQTALPKSKAPA